MGKNSIIFCKIGKRNWNFKIANKEGKHDLMITCKKLTMLKNSSHNFYHYFFIQVLHDRVQNRRKSAFLPIERAKSKSCSIPFFRSQILSRSLVTIMSQIRSLFFCHFFSKNGPQSDPDLDQIISRTYFWYCRLFYIPKSATKFPKQMFCHIKQVILHIDCIFTQ